MWPITTSQMKRLQIECTSFCNAYCPSCERAKYPYDDVIYNRPLNKHYITCDNIKTWLNFENYTELDQIHFCGNIDEPTLNPDILSILHYISEQTTDKTKIFLSTNGGTQNELFWKALSQIPKVITVFGIDGLEDTNHIYRKNVKWDKVLSNVTTYINHGGKGAWQFIVFEHNEHQVDVAKKYSQELGFLYFIEVNSRRPNYEVKEVSVPLRNSKSCIQCKATYDNQDLGIGFYIDVRGNVWPCCWMATTEIANAIAEKIGLKHGYYLAHNLHHDTLEDIVSSEFFTELYDKQESIDICNEKCKDETVDEFHWNI
jgi:molybdenum cofactor biosynthesis enzyme MoaA